MLDACCSNPLAGVETCELPAPALQRPVRQAAFCGSCGKKDKPVSVNLFLYFFCCMKKIFKNILILDI